jgi:hypothetical protein
MTIALTSYALAAGISFVTAALMALILKIVRMASRKRGKD